MNPISLPSLAPKQNIKSELPHPPILNPKSSNRNRNSETAETAETPEPQCRNLIKKPCGLIGGLNMDPTIWGVIDPGFLSQVPTLNLNPRP